VFILLTGGYPNVEPEAEVVRTDEGHDHLLIKSGTMTSVPLLLPARVAPGRKEIQNLDGHFEVKMAAVAHSDDTLTSSIATTDPIPLLDATQLTKAAPTSFLCASCSLPLVQSSKVQTYEDLPSEHWEELVDAWMCHSDQKLHEQVMKRGRDGFWPTPGQALVGASYILFDESAMVRTNTSQRDPNVSYYTHYFSSSPGIQEDRRWNSPAVVSPPFSNRMYNNIPSCLGAVAMILSVDTRCPRFMLLLVQNNSRVYRGLRTGSYVRDNIYF
jgi:hypothetical protein